MYTYICLYNSPTHALALPFLVILQAHGAPTSAREEDALRGLGLSYIRTECYYMYSIIHNPPPPVVHLMYFLTGTQHPYERGCTTWT